MIYTLHVQMKNGNCPVFEFFDLAEAEAYREVRRMDKNSAIRCTWIDTRPFIDWVKEKREAA